MISLFKRPKKNDNIIRKVNYHGFEMSQNLKALIEHSVKDGIITKAELMAINERVEREDLSQEEVGILIDSLIHDIRKTNNDIRKAKRKANRKNFVKKYENGFWAVLLFGIMILFIAFSVLEERTNMFMYTGKNDAKNIINAITVYDFQKARTHLSNIQSAIGDESSVEDILVEKHKSLSLQLYSAEIDFYLNNKSYHLAFQTSNDLYQFLNNYSTISYADYDTKFDTYYLPVMLRLIAAILDDEKKDEATKYAKSVSDTKIKAYLLSEINLNSKQ